MHIIDKAESVNKNFLKISIDKLDESNTFPLDILVSG
jgi:hypothetical protein